MPIFYKYLPRKFGKALLNKGSVKLGTLNGFKKMENDKARGDPNEGIRTSVLDIVVPGSNEDLDIIDQASLEGFIKFTDCPGAIVQATRSDICIDFYVYCVSELFSAEIARKLTEESGELIDCCIIIWSMVEFTKRLNSVLSSECKFFYPISKAVYLDTTRNYRENYQTPPFLFKKAKFEYQKEWRIAWHPVDRVISSKVIEVENLSKICSIIYFDKDFGIEN